MPGYTCPHCQELFRVPISSSAQVVCPHCQRATAVAAAAPISGKAPHPKRPAGPSLWLIAGLLGASACTVVGVCFIVVYFVFLPHQAIDPVLANQDQNIPDQRPVNNDSPRKKVDPPRSNNKPKPPLDKTPKASPRDAWAGQFVERLSRQRKYAGLSSVTLDAELSRGCQAHAKYLARHFDSEKADPSSLGDEDPKKPGYSVEGQRAGQNAMVAFGEPLEALDKWIGRVASRVTLLAPEMRSLGIGFEQDARGDWICVLDALRGRGDPIVAFPVSKQTEVPLSFTGGPEVPEGKVAGYPITVTFPPARQVTDANLELRDAANSRIEAWVWTPEKPLPRGAQRNTIALIPKGLLKSGARHQVKASAQVDGQAWSLAWSFTTEDDSDTKGVWAKKALDKVNAYRVEAGLKPVALDDQWSRGCLAHARYLVINEGHAALQGLKAHDEDLTLPGSSQEGDAAGKASDIAIGDYEPIDGVDAWMATLYHRVPLLEPSLRTIGFGCARGRRQGWVTVLNVTSGRAKEPRSQAVFYPVAEQTNVPLHFPNGGEEPNPIPEDKTGRAGFPITAFFPEREALKSANGKLTNSQGLEVLCWFSSQEKLANPKRPQGNTVCLIPKEPLAPHTIYHVQMQGQIAGQDWQKKWKFTTGASGLSVPRATGLVVERLNRYRTQAGLGTVALDGTLSRGCQLHADYLAKNADVIAKKNSSVNDEDELLPGFTRAGLRAAQQSDVFTNAPTPVMQIDDLMATFSRRVFLLDPTLQRIGFGCFHDVGRGWRCVLNLNAGRGDARVLLYPAPKQEDVPTVGFDTLENVNGDPGFPITVTFPRQANLRKPEAVLTDAAGKGLEIQLNEKASRGTIGVLPLEPLQAGQVYRITVSVIVDATEWRESWQFTTRKKK